MPLDPVEALINPAVNTKRRKVEYIGLIRDFPQPFINVARCESEEEEIYCPSLFLDSDGVPFHAHAIGADKIRIVNLCTYQTLLLMFHDSESYGTIVCAPFPSFVGAQ
jgi:hypothetical protein